MNWIFTIIFFIISFSHYILNGEIILSFFNYKKSLTLRLISGFFFTFFISFIVGFPCQLFYLSWDIYFILQSIVFLAIDFIFVFILRNSIMNFFKNIHKVNIKHSLSKILKNNWIGFLFVVLFIIFSVANQLPIYQLNYDDYYYIGKICNLIGTPHLLNENYYTGALLSNLQFDIVRTINTYELTYAYLSTVFHIDVTFFCRMTMNIHNYIFFYLVYKTFANVFINDSFAQYAIVPFFIFLIPQGYLHNFAINGELLPIRSYDLWQFQTAVFYGGSIVRMLSLPTLLYFSIPLIEKIQLKKILWIAILSISFISFSTIFFQMFILFILIIFIVYFIYQIYYGIKNKNKKIIFINISLLILEIIFICTSKYWDHLTFIDNDKYLFCLEQYIPFDYDWVRYDIIIKLFPLIFIFVIILEKNNLKRCLIIFVAILYFIIRSSLFYELLTITSQYFWFVSYRTIASMQYIILLFLGILSILIYCKFTVNKFVPNAVTLIIVTIICTFFYTHMNSFTNYVYGGSGISKDGWDFSRILDVNNKMTAGIYSEIGDYFNGLAYDNYYLYVFGPFYYDNIPTYGQGFIMSSNRIQLTAKDSFEQLNPQECKFLNGFIVGENEEVGIVNSLVEKNGIDYILLQDEHNAELLINFGFKLELEINNVSGNFYLLKAN